ncbi:MAG: AAA family ATPase [Bradymonadaceae bacterium]
MATPIKSISLSNILSFGPGGEAFPLKPLNVFIGPNGSGKSNLLEAIGLLKATPTDLARAVARGGGVSEWLWKGQEVASVARIEVVLDYPAGALPLRYALEFTEIGQRLELVDEVLENAELTEAGDDDVDFFYRYRRGRPVLKAKSVGDESGSIKRELKREDLSMNQSVLA